MRFFSRKPEAAPEAPAPAKRGRNSVTCGELNATIAAVTMELADCSARRTLEDIYALTDGTADGDIVTLNGPAPVTLAAFDDALAEVLGLGLPTGTLTPLKRVRELLARAEESAAAVGGEPVTRAEFDALASAHALALVVIADMLHDPRGGPLGVRLEAAVRAVEFKSAAAGIQALLDSIEKARSADGARQLRRASGRLQVASGAGGRNF